MSMRLEENPISAILDLTLKREAISENKQREIEDRIKILSDDIALYIKLRAQITQCLNQTTKDKVDLSSIRDEIAYFKQHSWPKIQENFPELTAQIQDLFDPNKYGDYTKVKRADIEYSLNILQNLENRSQQNIHPLTTKVMREMEIFEQVLRAVAEMIKAQNRAIEHSQRRS